MIFSPYKVLAIGIVSAALGFAGGWTTNDWRRDAGALKEERADNKAVLGQIDRAAEKGAAFEAKAEKIRVQTRTIYQEVERVVEKPIYRDVCLDDDGLRLLRAANSGKPLPTSEPVREVPGAAR